MCVCELTVLTEVVSDTLERGKLVYSHMNLVLPAGPSGGVTTRQDKGLVREHTYGNTSCVQKKTNTKKKLCESGLFKGEGCLFVISMVHKHTVEL